MSFSLQEAPESVFVKLLEKVDKVSLVRLRKTCRFVDEFVEKHRFHLSRRRPEDIQSVSYTVYSNYRNYSNAYGKKWMFQLRGNCRFNLRLLEGYKGAIHPYDQLSAFRINALTLNFQGSTDDETAQNLREQLTKFQRLKFSVKTLAIEVSKRSRKVDFTQWIPLVEFRNIEIPLSMHNSIAQIVSVPSVAKTEMTTFYIDDLDYLPSYGIHDLLKETRINTMNFSVTRKVTDPSRIARFVEEIRLLKIRVPNVQFSLRDTAFDTSLLGKKFRLIWKPFDHCEKQFSKGVFAASLKENLLILNISGRSFQDYDYPFTQTIGCTTISKTMASLKEELCNLTGETPDEHVLEHIFSTLV